MQTGHQISPPPPSVPTWSSAIALAKRAQSSCRQMSVSWSRSFLGSKPYFSGFSTFRSRHLGPHSCWRLKFSMAAKRGPSSCVKKEPLFRKAHLQILQQFHCPRHQTVELSITPTPLLYINKVHSETVPGLFHITVYSWQCIMSGIMIYIVFCCFIAVEKGRWMDVWMGGWMHTLVQCRVNGPTFCSNVH